MTLLQQGKHNKTDYIEFTFVNFFTPRNKGTV